MKKIENLLKLTDAGVVAVVRGESKEEALKASHAIIKGGMKGIELTFTVPHADEVLGELTEAYQSDPSIIIGAGTVLDAATARLAMIAGAQFIVSPSFDKETAMTCNRYQIPYLPGCMTITEMQTALSYGADIVKLFPGSAFGPSIVKAFKAPMPFLSIMPTGGVSLDNLEDWFKAGVVCVGVGGNLLKPAATGDFDQVTEVAAQYMAKFQTIKKELA
ncbi:MAG: bifunctional 4-hydroxy-2-oxoglutarate aldolase/2-dehydro-3-deoxy-phosphogluconate aldolase [Enterococcaceae bacterium]|jgi:2-dehydro-3-deoxyphosphogluconate aldolase/(4S)-4-hydroxy-2-oxoglutarate aldolase|nr:bifunctional 4-hydroxy-2-oxoglutarate aldolase/2-dehydro-3-deoxy-phosphogluconate aldolase [Enterococcaceae bacterium]MCI1918654.1 bifunctional 4-hydroxy-2-oxoglutarate aldolase/2-dehydro-3-deoxy-phosphogluconate aldolase [Enterococcaceae bacterium]